MENGKVFIWMNLLGFDRDDEDKGAKRFLGETGFIPDGCCGLLCHPDLVHHYRGMEEEYDLYPDNCSYNGVPRNTVRERQVWTNHDLRRLAQELRAAGSGLYISLFGVDTFNACHDEWIYHHPELMAHFLQEKSIAKGHHFLLKRFADGTYYEDFFIEKLCQVLADSGAKGVHLADALCPIGAGSRVDTYDFSTDFVEQFLAHTGITMPDAVAQTMGNDDFDAEKIRRDWIIGNCRETWIRFHISRWEQFFQKLCDRVHAVGCEVMVLGMYCTDPFETLYGGGLDLNRIVRAGVDYITANILPASGFITGGDHVPDPFHRYMAITPLTAAHLPKGHMVTMLGVQDATEEWSAIHHAPALHERDMFAMMAYQMVDKDGVSRASDGFFLCLGDGMTQNDWQWERERMEIAFSADAQALVSPAMLWSDAAFDAMLPEYLKTRRWTPHKLYFALADAGVHCGGAVRTDGLANHTGTLVVPNFDMLAPWEQQAVAAYDRGAVVCTASPDFCPQDYGITPQIQFSDRFSNYPMTVFAFGCTVNEQVQKAVEALLAEDDGTENLDVQNVYEAAAGGISRTLPYVKATAGFLKAMAVVLNAVNDCPFVTNQEHIVLKLKNGAYRLYLFNDSHVKYHRAQVSSRLGITDVKIVSKFPVLPPRFVDSFTGSAVDNHIFSAEVLQMKQNFIIKLPPAGAAIVDIWTE